MKMRGIHPSFLGRLDISVVGSDPGVNATITPFCETDGLFFNSKNEPEEFKGYFENEIFQYRKKHKSDKIIEVSINDEDEKLIESCDAIFNNVSIKMEKKNKKFLYVRYKIKNEEEDDIEDDF